MAAAGYALGALPFVVPAMEATPILLANPYVDVAITSAGLADAGNRIIKGEVKTPTDAALTALEIIPAMRNVVKPVNSAIKWLWNDGRLIQKKMPYS